MTHAAFLDRVTGLGRRLFSATASWQEVIGTACTFGSVASLCRRWWEADPGTMLDALLHAYAGVRDLVLSPVTLFVRISATDADMVLIGLVFAAAYVRTYRALRSLGGPVFADYVLMLRFAAGIGVLTIVLVDGFVLTLLPREHAWAGLSAPALVVPLLFPALYFGSAALRWAWTREEEGAGFARAARMLALQLLAAGAAVLLTATLSVAGG
jgi:hypothetical protein